MKCKKLTPNIFLHKESLSPDASSCMSGASKSRIRPFIKEMGRFPPVLQRKNGHQFALKRKRKLGTKHSAMETCLCGSQDPFLSVRIHMKSPLTAFRVSINSSRMIGIKGSKHSLLTKAPLCLPAAAPARHCPTPSTDRSHCAPVPQQLHREQRHQGTGAGACWSCGRKHPRRRKVRLKGRNQQFGDLRAFLERVRSGENLKVFCKCTCTGISASDYPLLWLPIAPESLS